MGRPTALRPSSPAPSGAAAAASGGPARSVGARRSVRRVAVPALLAAGTGGVARSATLISVVDLVGIG
jgi:hypothetical protein